MGATLVAAPIKPPAFSVQGDWRKQESDYIDTLATLAKRQHKGDIVGEVVRWQRADGYASYMVLSESPLRLVHLDLGDGYAVEASLLRGLTLAEVRRMVNWERSWKDSVNETNSVYETLTPGDIVHYRESSAAFVRCEVVSAPPGGKTPAGSDFIGGVALKPIALVGEIGRRKDATDRWIHGWAEYDLGQRGADGQPKYGYHARQVLEGELFQPNGANLFESRQYTHPLVGEMDPRGMEAIDLTPPPLSIDAERIARLVQILNRVRRNIDAVLGYAGPDGLKEIDLVTALNEIESDIRTSLDEGFRADE